MRFINAPLSLTILFLAMFPLSLAAQDGSIGIYANTDATENAATFTENVPTTIYIMASLEGATAAGMQGAEFRIAGLPNDWLYVLTPSPESNIALGDPFRNVGPVWRANLAFSSCQTGNNGLVLLYTVTIVPNSTVSDVTMTVLGGSPPSNPNLPTALMNQCNEPNYTAVPVQGRSFVINPQQLQPDLEVQSCDLSVSDPSPIPGQLIDLQARVHNIGSLTGLQQVAVRFLMDGIPIGGDVFVGPVLSGSHVLATSSIPWNADFLPHQLTVVVNPDSTVDESSYANNTADAVLPYDLRFEPIAACSPPPSMFPNCDPCLGDSMDLQAIVINDGLLLVDSVVVEFRDTTNGIVALERVTLTNLQARGSCDPIAINAAARTPVPGLGLFRFDVVADPDDEILEFDEGNNSHTDSLSITCTPSDWFDFQTTPCDLVSSNTSPAQGEPVFFEATVHNIGSLEAPPTSVRFLFDGSPLGTDVPVASIAAGGSRTVSSSIPWSVDSAAHSVGASVNPDGTLIETSRDNNLALAIVPYELSVTQTFVCPWDASPDCVPCLGDTVTLVATVQNLGLFDVDSVEVAFREVLPNAQELGTFMVHGIGGRSHCENPDDPGVSLSYAVNSGLNFVSATVDPYNRLPEFREDDNTQPVIFVVSCTSPVDLVITDGDIIPSQFNIQPGSSLDSVRVTVHNIGRQTAEDVRALLTMNDDPLCTDMQFGDIAAGGTVSRTCLTSWIAPEPPPFTHVLRACADPSGLIDELDESNNCASLGIGGGGNTPVVLTDLRATSLPEGVQLRWRALDEYPSLRLDRRDDREGIWEEIVSIPSISSADEEYAQYLFLDSGVLPGISYTYRIVGLDAAGPQFLGEVSVWFTPPVPSEFALYPNTPNPFNPTTLIRFAVPRRQHVKVDILDSTGRLVTTLWSGVVEAGYRTLTWKGTDKYGRAVTSGVYFTSLRCQSGRKTQKMVLLK